MVNKSVVLETVKKMLNQGIEEEVIVDTLKSIGLGEEEINETISEAKNSMQEPEKPEVEAEEEEDLSELEEDFEELEKPIKEEQIEDDFLKASMHSAIEGQGRKLDEHSKKLNEVHEKVSGLNEKISGVSIEELNKRIGELEKKLDGIEKELVDLIGLNSALKSLMQKVLDSQRTIIMDSEKKK